MSKKVLVFTASWCGPCKMLKPIIKDVSANFDQIPVEYIDIDSEDGQELTAKFNIRGVPTVKSFDGDVETASFTGTITSAQVTEFFEKI